jgi:CHAD domain-containing protein
MAAKPRPLLDSPVREVAARLAGNHLDAAARGLARIDDPTDPKGLHAFRVAIRRLRSLLREYGPWVGRVAGRKVRRRLRELTRATNEERDADVQIAWLQAQYGQLARNEQPGYRFMLRRLRDHKRRARRPAGDGAGGDFADVVRMMGNRLDETDRIAPCAFREAFLERLASGAGELQLCLSAISGADDEENVHRARIRVKRLRYLVEPLRREFPEARDLVRRLKDLQVLLGNLHDMHVLEDELGAAIEVAATEKARKLHQLALSGDEKTLEREQGREERPGLLALAARARERRDALFAEIARKRSRDRRALQGELDALRDAAAPAEPRRPSGQSRRNMVA